VRAARIPLTSFSEHRQIDRTIDGADKVERGTLATAIVAGSTIFGTKDYKAAIAARGAAKQATSRAPAACRALGSFSRHRLRSPDRGHVAHITDPCASRNIGSNRSR